MQEELIVPPHTTLHDALENAVQREGHRSLDDEVIPPTIVTSFRTEKELKEATDVICKANGTTLNGFLRECCRGLVRDYRLER